MSQIYQTPTLTSTPIALKVPKLRRAISGTRSATVSIEPIITYNNNSPSSLDTDDYQLQEINNNNDKQTTYTIKRTYIAPNGITRTKTFEYHGDEAKKNDRDIYHHYNNNQQQFYTQPIKVIQKFKPHQKGCISSKSHSTTSEKFLFIKESLDQHNRYRYIHRVPYLKLNRELCKLAQEWAEKIASTGKFEHSNHKYLNQSLGENIAMRYTSTGDELDGKQMTEQWYEEAATYDYKLDFQSGKGHFAQIVWKDTREVGFGRAKSTDGKWYAVANYYPAGNYIGRFRENVLPSLNSN